MMRTRSDKIKYLEDITDFLIMKGKCVLWGFGTFRIKLRAERTAYLKGEPYIVPAHHIIIFTPSKVLNKKIQYHFDKQN